MILEYEKSDSLCAMKDSLAEVSTFLLPPFLLENVSSYVSVLWLGTVSMAHDLAPVS